VVRPVQPPAFFPVARRPALPLPLFPPPQPLPLFLATRVQSYLPTTPPQDSSYQPMNVPPLTLSAEGNLMVPPMWSPMALQRQAYSLTTMQFLPYPPLTLPTPTVAPQGTGGWPAPMQQVPPAPPTFRDRPLVFPTPETLGAPTDFQLVGLQ
jgi:hypothetical protein